MLVKEDYGTTKAGVELVRTYSDEGFYIESVDTGMMYEEAIDPKTENREYTETDIYIDPPEPTIEELSDEEADAEEEAMELMGL